VAADQRAGGASYEATRAAEIRRGAGRDCHSAAAVDAFFNKVMVLDPDPALRGAHLGLIDGCSGASRDCRLQRNCGGVGCGKCA